jgi:hypothetical protein
VVDVTRVGLDRAVTELRVAGPALVATAVAVPAAGAVLVAVMALTGADHRELARMAVVVLEGVCPLAIAITAVSLVGRDPAMELALAAPVAYRRVFAIRAGLLAGTGALLTLIVAVAFFATDAWPAGIGIAGVALVWLAPTVALTGVGVLVAAWTASAAVGSGVIGGVWLAEALFAGEFAARPILRAEYLFATVGHLHGGAWWTSRGGLTVTGVAAITAAGALLGQRARLGRLLTTEAS